jgi:hypothetical protein
MDKQSNTVPHDVQKIYDAWVFFRRSWWFFHYAIGITGVIAAITAANKPQFLQDPPILLNAIGWLSAVCVATLTFLEPKKRARAYSAAWRILHKAVGTYRHTSPTPSAAMLFEAISQGEEVIAKLDG